MSIRCRALFTASVAAVTAALPTISLSNRATMGSPAAFMAEEGRSPST